MKFSKKRITKALISDQTARMGRLVHACVVRKPPKTGFLARWSADPKIFFFYFFTLILKMAGISGLQGNLLYYA